MDILINSAGLGSKTASLLGGDTAAWKETLDVNVLALCVATREAVANMMAREVRVCARSRTRSLCCGGWPMWGWWLNHFYARCARAHSHSAEAADG